MLLSASKLLVEAEKLLIYYPLLILDWNADTYEKIKAVAAFSSSGRVAWIITVRSSNESVV